MRQLFKSKKELILWVNALVLLILLLIYTIYSITFLGRKINQALFVDLTREQGVIRFDFDKLNDALRGKTGFSGTQ